VSTEFIQPSIEILNLRIDEPVTTLTDILLAGICFYAFFQTGKLEKSGSSKSYFRLYFLILGLGALVAVLVPSRRAASVEPLTVIRYE